MNIEDLRGRLSEKAAAIRQAHVYRDRQSVVQGKAMSELFADPHWEVWERHVNFEKQRRELLFKSMGEMLLASRNKLTLEKFEAAKLDLAEHEAWIAALKFAVDIAKDVIERGEKAAEEIEDTIDRGAKPA